ncbi:MAG: glycoside hydrolase, partial [Bryobacteraceae bacterium]
MPTFQHVLGGSSYTLVGQDPQHAVATTIRTVLVPVSLSFEAKKTAGKPFLMDATLDVPRVLRSPVFSSFAFPTGGVTQYGDAMLRTTFPKAEEWHTLLGKPQVRAIKINIPVAYGYILTSKKTGRSFGVVDVEFLQQELFKQIPKQEDTLIVAVTHNITYYADGDATLCCSWGTHGVDSATGNSFILASYLHSTPAIVEDGDVQPITQQLGEFINDPLHDPLLHDRQVKDPGNTFPAWLRPASMHPGDQGSCGGIGVASAYFLLEPTNTNPKNNFPASKGFVADVRGTKYHLQNVALLPWYVRASEGLGRIYSFPDAQALTRSSKPCPPREPRLSSGGGASTPPEPTVAAVPMHGSPNGHKLIGYWAGYGAAGSTFPLREVSPQWDII